MSSEANVIPTNNFVLFLFTVYIALGLLISLQPPFYPSEAEAMGASPAEYGFVFGIANLSLFIFRKETKNITLHIYKKIILTRGQDGTMVDMMSSDLGGCGSNSGSDKKVIFSRFESDV